MILPIVAYGTPVLRKICKDIPTEPDDEIRKLIDDMWETMYNANGVGLAAPQIGQPIRIFIVDTIQIFDDLDEEDSEELEGQSGVKKVFINPEITSFYGDPYPYNEGCLSLPGVREDVVRDEAIDITYLDENMKEQHMSFHGINSRVIQHEYDHIEGVLFIDYLKPLKKRMLQKKLNNISKGNINVPYKMKYPQK